MQKYGKILLNHLPQHTTQLLIDLCTGDLRSRCPEVKSTASASTSQPAANVNNLVPFLQFGPTTTTQAASPNPVEKPASTSPEPQTPTVRPKERTYRPPFVRTFMPLFVDQPNYLIQFLEQVSQKRWGGFGSVRKPPQEEKIKSKVNDADTPDEGSEPHVEETPFEVHDSEAEEKKAVWNTLLELYLSEAYLPLVISGKDSKGRKYGAPGAFSVSTETERVKEKLLRKDKALQLLKDNEVHFRYSSFFFLTKYDFY